MATTRRRGEALIRDIRTAALAEVADRGYAGATVDGIAERAGTSKHVLYRRWSTKAAMVFEAMAAAHPGIAVPPDTGSLTGDLKALLTAFRSSVEAFGRQTALAMLAEPDSESTPTVRQLLHTRSAELVEPLIDRARRRGELGDAALPATLVLLPLDLARHELLVGDALPDSTLDAIVDEVTVPLLTSRSHDRRPTAPEQH